MTAKLIAVFLFLLLAAGHICALERIANSEEAPPKNTDKESKANDGDVEEIIDGMITEYSKEETKEEIDAKRKAVLDSLVNKEEAELHFIWPVKGGKFTSGFGPRHKKLHPGIDIKVPKGTPIVASESGEVIFSGTLKGYGLLVKIRHANGYETRYAHNSKLIVKKGQTVKKGDTISLSGKTGRASCPHLHFEIRSENLAQNPVYYLPEKILDFTQSTEEETGL